MKVDISYSSPKIHSLKDKMNTLKNNLKERFIQAPSELIVDMDLCNGSLRVLLYLFTKPNNWNVYNKDICKQLDISDKTLGKYWKELLASRWLKRRRRLPGEKDNAGGFEYEIGFFAKTEQSSDLDNSDTADNSSTVDKKVGHSNNKPIKQEVTTIVKSNVANEISDVVIEKTQSDLDAEKIADLLYSKILTEQPEFKGKKESWIADIEKAIRIDGRNLEKLIKCINWIYSPKGEFWKANILSGKKLRSQFDQMWIAAQRSNQANGKVNMDSTNDAIRRAREMRNNNVQ